MEENQYINHFFKIVIIIIVVLIFAAISILNVEVAGLLSLGFFLLSIVMVSFTKISEKQFFLIFFFIYPLLPSLWGINLPFGMPVLRAHRVAVMMLILFLVMKGLFLKYFSNFIKSRSFTLPLVFIVFFMFITSFLSEGKGASFFSTFSFILESIILAVAVYNAFPERNDLELLVSVLCYSTIILACIGLYEKMTEYNIYSILGSYRGEESFEYQMRDGVIRIIGSFGHSISFGSYFALLLPLILYKYRNGYIKFYSCLVLIIFVIMGTQSRGSIIGAYLAVGLYFIFLDRKKLGISLLASTPLIIIFFKRIVTYLMEMIPFTATNPELLSSTMARSRQLNFYVNIIKENILFGYGLEPAPPLMMMLVDSSAELVYNNSIDNFYLGFTYQYGVMGLIAWSFLMILVILKPIMLYGRAIFSDKLILSLLFSFFIFDVINYIVFLWHYHFVFWIYLGILARLMVIKKNELMNAAMPEIVQS